MESSKTVHRLSTVDNAISLLTLFLKYKSIGLVDIERELNISKTAAFRLAVTLTDRGFLLKDAKTKMYHPGPVMFQIVNRFNSPDIVEISKPYMQKLAEETGESIYLSIRSGNKFMYLDGIESKHVLKVASPIGEEIDLYFGAAGKIHMSHMSQKDLDTYFKRTSFEKFTLSTPDIESLKNQLDEIRAKGYAWSFGERIHDFGGVAAPIWGGAQEPIAVLAIYLPLSRYTEEFKDVLQNAVCNYAEQISDAFENQK